ncbi:MAG TPA: metal ABC transporter permease, partial [Rectinema sp.]|nr:metal ABC transporter permease [Rectinema sp.]
MMELLKIPAFGRAFVALFASGMAFPILGIYILSLDLIPVRFGVMHLSLLGATIGLIVGIDPILLAMLFSIGAGFAVSALSSRKTGGDSGGAMALLMTASLGIVFILFY